MNKNWYVAGAIIAFLVSLLLIFISPFILNYLVDLSESSLVSLSARTLILWCILIGIFYLFFGLMFLSFGLEHRQSNKITNVALILFFVGLLFPEKIVKSICYCFVCFNNYWIP
jgi:hypothetical protein